MATITQVTRVRGWGVASRLQLPYWDFLTLKYHSDSSRTCLSV